MKKIYINKEGKHIEKKMCILIDYLHHILLLAKDTEFPSDSMIVAGIDTITDAYALAENENECLLLSAKIAYSFLPNADAFETRVLEVLENFNQDKDLAWALICMLESCRTIVHTMTQHIYQYISSDENIRKLIQEPEKKYANEFDIYLDHETHYISITSDSSDNESAIEEFNEDYQNLAPSREEQLDRLTNKLKIELCEECLYPNNGQACDCWLQELGESYFD
jgi:hypothetical protein